MKEVVYVIQAKDTGIIHGCFKKKQDAEDYIIDDYNAAVMKLEVEP